MKRQTLITITVLWLAAVFAGMGVLWNYQNAPGQAATPPLDWPAGSSILRDSHRPTLVMFAHPRCPCTRASVGELNILMTRCQGRLTAYVLFYQPSGQPGNWDKTDLWRSAAAVPGIQVRDDKDGREARRFHAATSGQTYLYDTNGPLLFSGGITGARGHAGDNAGRGALESLLLGGSAVHTRTLVFGCSLLGPPRQEEKSCRK
ncbi:MAG: hypothetical protein M3Y13_15145 [Armatimonadota bacterium]|nr:hypothetical protein [Armatimonadota bacterium]